jgi:hypothetical protein
MKIMSLAAAAAILIPVQVSAQESPFQGVYVRSVEQCTAAKKDPQAFQESGEIVMNAEGMWAIEYNCQFVDWKPRKIGPGGVIIAICEEPGYATPEVYAVMPRGEGELELTVPISANQGEEPGNYGMWYLCDGLKMPAG